MLEYPWVEVALGELDRARRTIDAIPRRHPFQLRWQQVRNLDREHCARVLDSDSRRRCLSLGWRERESAPAAPAQPCA